MTRTRETDPTGFNPTHVYSKDELAALWRINEKKIRGWLNGYRVSGEHRTAITPLRHFRDGELILIRGSWFLDFLEANPHADS